MSLEIIMIILTGIISLMDLMVNVVIGGCTEGYFKSSCCGASIEHNEDAK